MLARKTQSNKELDKYTSDWNEIDDWEYFENGEEAMQKSD